MKCWNSVASSQTGPRPPCHYFFLPAKPSVTWSLRRHRDLCPRFPWCPAVFWCPWCPCCPWYPCSGSPCSEMMRVSSAISSSLGRSTIWAPWVVLSSIQPQVKIPKLNIQQGLPKGWMLHPPKQKQNCLCKLVWNRFRKGWLRLWLRHRLLLTFWFWRFTQVQGLMPRWLPHVKLCIWPKLWITIHGSNRKRWIGKRLFSKKVWPQAAEWVR